MNSLSNMEEELKRILETQEYEYIEGDWLKAKKLLARKKRRRLAAFWLIPVLLLGGAFSAWWMIGGQHTTAVLDKTSAKTQAENGVKNNTTQKGKATESITLAIPNDADNATQNQTPVNEKTSKQNDFTGKVNTDKLKKQAPEKEPTLTETEDLLNKPKQVIEIKESETADAIDALTETQHNTLIGGQGTKNNVLHAKDLNAPALATPFKGRRILLAHSLSLMAGGNYSRMLQSSGDQNLRSPYAGIMYQLHLGSYWQIGGGIAYSVLSGGNMEKQFESKRHSFGVTTTTTTVKAGKLHYIEMPIFAKRAVFNDKINFIGGINTGYLVSADNIVSESKGGTFGGKTQATKNIAAGNRGISDWDFQLFIGAETRFYNRWYGGVLAGSSLFDVGTNSYYNNTVTERNTRLQLYIRYEFFKF